MKRVTRWVLMGLLLAGLAVVIACSSDKKKDREGSDAGPDSGDTSGVSTDTTAQSTDVDSDTGTGTGDIEIVDAGPDLEVAGKDALSDAPNGVLVIDNYESYADNDALLDAYSIATEGNDINFTLDPVMKNSGNYGMKVDFTLGASSMEDAGTTDDAGVAIDAGDTGPDYAGAMITIDQDWRGARAVQFWVKADQMNQVVVFQFMEEDGDYWELEYPVQGTSPYMAEIAMDEFNTPPWDEQDADDPMDLSYIIQFALYMRGPAGTSVVYLDDLQVVAGEMDTATEPLMDAGDDTATPADAGDSDTTATVDGGI